MVNSLSMNSAATVAIAVALTVTDRAFSVVSDAKRGLSSSAVTCDDLTGSAFGACTDADQLRNQSR